MTDAVKRIAELTREGLDLYPADLRGFAQAPRKGHHARPLKPAAVSKFVEWVKLAHPRLFAAAVKKAGAANGLGQTATQSPLDRVLSTISTLAPVYLQARAQKEIFDAQMQRLSQGLPPLPDPSAYAPTMRIGIDPATVERAADAAAARAQPWLLWGGLALGGFLLFSMLRKRR